MSWHVKFPCAAQVSRTCESLFVVALQSRPQAQFGFALLGAAELLVLGADKRHSRVQWWRLDDCVT
jgi:hypothetical protein